MGIALAAALIVSLAANWVVRLLATNFGWLSVADSKRHIHKRPVPRLGGIGIFFSFAIVTGTAILVRPAFLKEMQMLRLLVPATVMFGLGVWDDVRPLSAKIKLTFQIAAGLALYGWIRFTPLGERLANLEIGIPLLLLGTVAWVVLISNSINLIDGVDGLAGGTASLSLAAIFCLASRSGENDIAFMSAVLIGATLGFLPFNFNPATMFLGDGGSLFLGFMLSAMGAGWGKSGAIADNVAVAVAILALPLSETGISVTRRFLSGRPIFSPDREHMHHKLIDRGFSQRHLVWALYGVAAVCGAAGFAIALGGRHVVLGGLAVLLFVFLVGFMTLGYVEFREIKRIGRRILEQRQVVANDVIIRKISQLIKKNSCLGELAEELRTAFFEAGFDGFELVLPDAMKLKFPCDLRSYATSWGCTDQHSASFWTMSVDLKGCSGRKLGCIRLSRKTEGGSLLFDANLLMSELQPALVSALERCISRDCSRRNSDAAVCQAPLKQIRRPAVVEYAPSSTLDDSQKVAQNLDDVGRSEKSN